MIWDHTFIGSLADSQFPVWTSAWWRGPAQSVVQLWGGIAGFHTIGGGGDGGLPRLVWPVSCLGRAPVTFVDPLMSFTEYLVVFGVYVMACHVNEDGYTLLFSCRDVLIEGLVDSRS